MFDQPPTDEQRDPPTLNSFQRALARIVGQLEHTPTVPPGVDPNYPVGTTVEIDSSLGTDALSETIKQVLDQQLGFVQQTVLIQQAESDTHSQSDDPLPEDWIVPQEYSSTRLKHGQCDQCQGNFPPLIGASESTHLTVSGAGPDQNAAVLYGAASAHFETRNLTISQAIPQFLWYVEVLHDSDGRISLHAVFDSNPRENSHSVLFSGPISESSPMTWFEIGRDAGVFESQSQRF